MITVISLIPPLLTFITSLVWKDPKSNARVCSRIITLVCYSIVMIASGMLQQLAVTVMICVIAAAWWRWVKTLRIASQIKVGAVATLNKGDALVVMVLFVMITVSGVFHVSK